MNAQNILKKIRLDSTSRDALIGIFIAGLVGANLLLTTTSLRIDLSKGQAYSLSPSTAKVVNKLKDPVEITFFVSDNVPTSFITSKNTVADLLREYRNLGSKVNVKTVDPKRDEAMAKEASEYGIAPVEFSQIENDQFAVSNGYFGLGIKMKDKKASIPQIDISNLEYNITSSIFKLSQVEDQKVVVVGGGSTQMSEPSRGDTLMNLQQILDQQFTVINSPLDTLGSDTKALVLVDNIAQGLESQDVEGVRSYLRSGGKAIIMTYGVDVTNNLTVATAESKLAPLLADYGVKVNPDLVLSNQAEIVNFGNSQNSRLLTRYPYWLSTNVFNPQASYTSNVSHLTFPWTSSIKMTKKEGISQKEIVKSTPDSWKKSGMSDALPQGIAKPANSDLGEQLLIGYATSQKYGSEIVVIPSVRFVQDGFLGRSGNLEFVLNLVNEFASEGLLSGIRSRASTAVQISPMAISQKDFFKWGNVLFLPGLFAIYGAYRLSKRG